MEKQFEKTNSEGVNVNDEREFSIRLPVNVSDYVEHTASKRGLTAERLLTELIMQKVMVEIEPLDVQLRRVNKLIKEIIILTKKTPMQAEKDAGTGKPSFELRKKKRDHLIELGMQAYDELGKITRSEKTAKEAEFRMQAFMVMARMGSFNAAVIRDQEAEELALMIEELERGNFEIDEKIKELERKKKEEDEKQRWSSSV